MKWYLTITNFYEISIWCWKQLLQLIIIINVIGIHNIYLSIGIIII